MRIELEIHELESIISNAGGLFSQCELDFIADLGCWLGRHSPGLAPFIPKETLISFYKIYNRVFPIKEVSPGFS